MKLLPFRRRHAPPNETELWILSNFSDAIEYASRKWKSYDASLAAMRPNYLDTTPLTDRIGLVANYLGLYGDLLRTFPQISDIGNEVNIVSVELGHPASEAELIILSLILCEAVIKSGTHSREEVRVAAGYW